ncbi:hypothetical protein O5264_29750, partial [Escherichia coli]|nr:hypothetical protein [Escherichia coli]
QLAVFGDCHEVHVVGVHCSWSCTSLNHHRHPSSGRALPPENSLTGEPENLRKYGELVCMTAEMMASGWTDNGDGTWT